MNRRGAKSNLLSGSVDCPELLECITQPGFRPRGQSQSQVHEGTRTRKKLLMKLCLTLLAAGHFAISAQASVRVFVQDTNGVAWLKYQCTAGEVVRSFALDVTVDQGVIFGVSDFLVGVSKPAAKGYGIFPASFRDHATVNSGTNVTFDATQYSPAAVVADFPSDTRPGLNSSGITLEFGALWDPNLPAAIPGPTGTLCALHLSRAANVSVTPNVSRGGVIASPPDVALTTIFAGTFVDADAVILSATVTNGVLNLTFKGGELETAPAAPGPWTGTGNSTGSLSEAIATSGSKFYRVHHR
jgi:hypothetical protein